MRGVASFTSRSSVGRRTCEESMPASCAGRRARSARRNSAVCCTKWLTDITVDPMSMQIERIILFGKNGKVQVVFGCETKIN